MCEREQMVRRDRVRTQDGVYRRGGRVKADVGPFCTARASLWGKPPHSPALCEAKGALRICAWLTLRAVQCSAVQCSALHCSALHCIAACKAATAHRMQMRCFPTWVRACAAMLTRHCTPSGRAFQTLLKNRRCAGPSGESCEWYDWRSLCSLQSCYVLPGSPGLCARMPGEQLPCPVYCTNVLLR